MSLDYRISRKRFSDEGQFRESNAQRRDYNVRSDFFHRNEDCTFYRRNLCFICQNPNIALDKLRTCQSCGKLVCNDCSHICNGCKRMICSFCENTIYTNHEEIIVCIDCYPNWL